MAITKIHPIKTTLDVSIDYICDPGKTDEEILISTHGCGYKTAAIEFQKTKDLANSQCKNLARHLIQSFMPGEVTPEDAHRIGKELCENHLNGRHEYVLTTHVDKGHIHNHIIFNNVSFIDGKSYISNKRSYHKIRNISDNLCRNSGLSIATEIPTSRARNKINGTSYKEYQERKNGNSYKARLQYSIDAAIRKAQDWEDFLRILQENGYEIKYGKHISFRATGQERYTRSKTIGEDYTEERIKERIEITLTSRQNNRLHPGHSKGKVIDISTNRLAQESAGFARWLKLQNLKAMSKSWSVITDLTDIESFNEYIEEVHDDYTHLQSKIKANENEIAETQSLIKNIDTYIQYNQIYSKYLTTTDKDEFFRCHEKEIILCEAAKQSFKQQLTNELLSSVPSLKEKITELDSQLKNHQLDLKSAKEKIAIANSLQRDLDIFIRSGKHLGYDEANRTS